MSNTENSKQRLLLTERILYEKTDEDHPISKRMIMKELEKYELNAGARTVARDIDALEEAGIDVRRRRVGNEYMYYIGKRQLEFSEIKLLIDIVQSSAYISEACSRKLIGKLKKMLGKAEEVSLNSQIYITGRSKTLNETVFDAARELHFAVAKDCQVSFRYLTWNMDNEIEAKHEGELYRISPYYFIVNGGFYYMIGYDRASDKLKHYRIDRMMDIHQMKEKREGKELAGKVDIARYSRKYFGMYDGAEADVSLLCRKNMADAIHDTFGQDIRTRKQDEEHFTVHANAMISRMFYGFIFANCMDIAVLKPDWVATEYHRMLLSALEKYEKEEGEQRRVDESSL